MEKENQNQSLQLEEKVAECEEALKKVEEELDGLQKHLEESESDEDNNLNEVNPVLAFGLIGVEMVIVLVIFAIVCAVAKALYF